mgnify:CR=1 FL=1
MASEVARLVGMELREYEKDGKKRQFCGLHLVHVEDTVPDVMGCKVEEVSCPREVDPNDLEIGKLYELGYNIYTMRGQKMARLSALYPVEDAPAAVGGKK